MRIEELVLERYGLFQDVRLALDGAATRLHVIFGPNEAGKSTALEAISDLLFGFERETPYGFAHGYQNLLIGATLSNRVGQTLNVKRRKGQKNTLLDAQGAALPDTVLGPFLGGLGRRAFQREFGLSYHRLRDGGDQMLEAEGDLARSLFQAASGLPNVVKVQEALKAEAEALWPQRKAAGKPLWAAFGDYEDARKRMGRESLQFTDWNRAEEVARQAALLLETRKAGLEALRRERNRLQRHRQALPVLARLDALAGQLAPLADAPDLPADFAGRWRQAVSREATAAAEVRRLTAELAALRTALDELPPPGPLPAHAGRIEQLFRKSGDLAAKRDDGPKLRRDLEHSDGRLAQFIVQLGSGLGPADLDRHRPSKPVVARIRTLIGDHGALQAGLAARAEQVTAARDSLRETEEAQAALGQPVDAAEARAALDEALKAGDLEARLAAAERAAGQAAAAATAALARLGLWTGSLASLTATPFPGRETVQEALSAGQALEADRRRSLEARDKARAEVRRFEGGLRDLEAGAEIPTPKALDQARRHREQGWRLIRGGYIDRTLDPAQAAAGYAPVTGDLAGAYEEAVHRADDLVDRREREAQRIQGYLTLQRQATEARDEAERQEAGLVEITARIAAHQARWTALWQASGLEPADPAGMLAWLQRKDEAVRAAEARLTADGEVQGLSRQRAAMRDHLLRAGSLPGLTGLDDVPTPVLRDRVKAAVDRATRTWTEAGRLTQERSQRRGAVERAEASLAAVRERSQAWHRDWVRDMPALGLPAPSGVVEAEAALEIWEAIEKELVNRRQTLDRLQGIEADLAAGRAEVTAFVANLGEAAAGPAPNPADVLDLPQHLNDRLTAAQQLLARRHEIAARIAGHEAALAAARREWETAGQGLGVLRTSHSLDAAAEPLVEADRAGRRRALEERLAEARRDLDALAVGQTEAELRAETADADPDALAARAQAIDDDEKRWQQDLEEATRAEFSAAQEVEALRHRAGIADAAQQAEDAKQRAAALAARWVRLWAAQAILEAAIQRFRNANEHPLVRRASEIFALIAGTGRNPIERLTVEYGGKKDQPVLMGLRRDGSRCPVEGMSDGTRDQLYLALRIAAVETAAVTGEPMPFIADDLFITSDDERTGPGLKALAELGRKTQVLLFTHHRSVVEAARAVIEPEGLRVHGLGGDAGVP
jgi:uncharacterized protein YhaN